MAQQNNKLGVLENVVLGGTTAVVFLTALAPLERVKLMRQCQGEIVKQGRISEPYRGVIDCAVRTYRNEGILSFWRSNFVHCLQYFPSQALSFALKEKMKQVNLFKGRKTDSYAVTFIKNIASGSLAGAISISLIYPLDYARNRLAADVKEGGSERQFKGLIDVYKKTLKSDGIVGLYRGFVIACVGITVYRGCYFGFFDALKPILLGEKANLPLSFVLGYAVTVCAGLISYPIDTIRRRMMMTSGQAVKYRGSWDCAVQILRNEGAMAFMNGAGLSILRGVAGAGMLVGFNKVKEVYVQWRQS